VVQYHLDELPALFIVDPITGAKLWQKSGFVSPDTLIEELVPFLDMGEQACTPAAVAGPNVGTVSCWQQQTHDSNLLHVRYRALTPAHSYAGASCAAAHAGWC
jgi:hypothetical protein